MFCCPDVKQTCSFSNEPKDSQWTWAQFGPKHVHLQSDPPLSIFILSPFLSVCLVFSVLFLDVPPFPPPSRSSLSAVRGFTGALCMDRVIHAEIFFLSPVFGGNAAVAAVVCVALCRSDSKRAQLAVRAAEVLGNTQTRELGQTAHTPTSVCVFTGSNTNHY